MIALLVISLVSSAYCTEYSDEFARMLIPLSSAAYVDNPWMCLALHFPKSVMQRQITIDCGKKTTCSGFTAVLHSHKAIDVSFRLCGGTTDNLQLLDEAIKSIINSWVDWPYGGMVSKYLFDAFMEIWETGMREDMELLRARYPNYEVWVTGHSLGGAIASLAAHYAAYLLTTPSELLIGETSYPISHLSTRGQEIFYKEGMAPNDYIVCKEYEDFKCSDGLWVHTSIKNHIKYFGKVIRDWGTAGCL
ncbi:hypothetical protein Aduo_011685 [Ancylostoma duodenale]